MLPRKNLIILAVFESTVMFSAIIRVAIPGLGIDFERPPQLAWFLATMLLSGAALAQYVVRAGRLSGGEGVEEERKQVFTVSLAMLVGATLLSLAGPGAFEQLFR